MAKFIGILKESFTAVKSFKLRTFFSIIGIALGIASLSIIVAAVEGAFKRAYEVVESFGPESVLIFGGSQEQKGIRNRQKILTIYDIEDLRRTFPEIKIIMPIVRVRTKVYFKGKVEETRLYGVDINFEEAWSWYLLEGRMFTPEELRLKKNVCIIGKYLKDQLFGNIDPVGKSIILNRLSCKIIGVLSERGTTPTGRNLDNRVLMPYTTVMYKINHDPVYITSIRIRYYPDVKLSEVIKETENFLIMKHKGNKDDFFILSPTEILDFLVALTGTLILFLGFSSAISLSIGGFVLANLFLLSVSERRKEIGIRKALGAKKRDILLQFISEAVIITSFGAILGFILGIIGANLLKEIVDFPVHFSFEGFLIAFIVSFIVGILSSLNPALKASKLNPIEAIRG
ncbi:ABC transporter permease [Persephonella sp.]